MTAGLLVGRTLACGILVEPVEAFGAELAKGCRGFVGAPAVVRELLLEFPPAVLAPGTFERPLQLPEFTLVRVGRHFNSPVSR